ncbi:MAG: hypothetical protein GXO45_02525 [Aquificae bacterium]|nr:hypothetical protein [Aquificota bacterium]
MTQTIPYGRRYSGEITLGRYCDKLGIDMDFDLVFSGFVEEAGEGNIQITKVNPYKIHTVFKEGLEFKLFIPQEKDNYIAHCNVLKVDKDKIVATVGKPYMIKDKRRFHRFSFCCKDLGSFSLYKNGRLVCEDVCINEIGRAGVRILNPCVGAVNKGDTVQVVNQDIEITCKILHSQNNSGVQILGAEITETNTNLINYIINKYIKVAEEIIYKLG